MVDPALVHLGPRLPAGGVCDGDRGWGQGQGEEPARRRAGVLVEGRQSL